MGKSRRGCGVVKEIEVGGEAGIFSGVVGNQET